MGKCGKIENMILDESFQTDLADEKDAIITEHVNVCEDCKNTVKEIKKVRSLLKNIKRLQVSPDFTDTLRSKLESVRSGEYDIGRENADKKTVPLFTRIAYYGAGIAAVVVGMLFLGGEEIFNDNNGSLTDPSLNSAVFANADSDEAPVKSITDSLKNIKDPVKDENLIKSVSTGE